MKTELTEQKIQEALNHFFASEKYNIDGLFVFSWESDKLLKTRAGYYYEFEIKITRADFKNDFKHKIDKHIAFSSIFSGKDETTLQLSLFDNLYGDRYGNSIFRSFNINNHWKRVKRILKEQHLPNYFYYAVPEGMINPDEIPPYAGLVYISENGKDLRHILKAPLLHKKKLTDEELNLSEKFYYNMKTWQVRYKKKAELLQYELERAKQDKPYKVLLEELDSALERVNRFKEEAFLSKKLYYTMVEGADYEKIERHLMIDELKKYDPNFEKRYLEIMNEANLKYKERYPNRKT